MDNPTQWIFSPGLRIRAHKKPFYACNFINHNTCHVLHDALKAQSQSEVNGEPPDKIALDVENQSEVKVEPELLLSLQDQINESLSAKNTSGHKTTHVPRDETAPETENQSKVKNEAKLNKSLSAKNTSGHKTTHVPRDETAPQAQNQPEVKNKAKLNKSLAAKNTSGHKTTHVPRNETASEAQNQSVKCPMNEKKTEWVMLTTSVLLEAMSSVFEQVGYALPGMVIAFLALFLSSVYLICKARKEGVERSQPSGGLLDYYGLAAAVWQFFNSTMEYLYTRKNQQNPLKICLLPFMFALFVLLFSLFKCRT